MGLCFKSNKKINIKQQGKKYTKEDYNYIKMLF